MSDKVNKSQEIPEALKEYTFSIGQLPYVKLQRRGLPCLHVNIVVDSNVLTMKTSCKLHHY